MYTSRFSLTAVTMFLSVILFTFMIFSLSGAPAFAEGQVSGNAAASDFISALGNKAMDSVVAGDLTDEERASRAKTIVHDNFDVQTIGRFALGAHWDATTETQRGEYLGLFEDMIAQICAGHIKEYSGQSFNVTGVKAGEKSSRDFVVSSKILQKNAAPVAVDWRVRERDGQFKVVDIYVDDVSMAFTYRTDFNSVLAQGDGNVETLLASLRGHAEQYGEKQIAAAGRTVAHAE